MADKFIDQSQVRTEWQQLRDALEEANFEDAAALVQRNPDILEARNSIGETVLHFLAVENNLPAVEWLRARGANTNVVNEFGTPLILEVALLEHRELFIWMLKHGADWKSTNAEGESILDLLALLNQSDMIAFVKEHSNCSA